MRLRGGAKRRHLNADGDTDQRQVPDHLHHDDDARTTTRAASVTGTMSPKPTSRIL
jgi:hypothetical protein